MKKHVYPSLIILLGLLTVSHCSSLPVGREGAEAKKLGDFMLSGAQFEKWQKSTAAVTFRYRDAENIFWDKKRGLVEVGFKDNVIQFVSATGESRCLVSGQPVTGADCGELTNLAVKKFVNNTYWLNPAFHISSPGAVWKVTDQGKLLVSYASGGQTPGDSYVFTLDEEGKIVNMQTWASSLKIKGTNIPFSDYLTTETGVKIATKHKVYKIASVDLTDLKMFASYPETGAEDRFAPLLKKTPAR